MKAPAAALFLAWGFLAAGCGDAGGGTDARAGDLPLWVDQGGDRGPADPGGPDGPPDPGPGEDAAPPVDDGAGDPGPGPDGQADTPPDAPPPDPGADPGTPDPGPADPGPGDAGQDAFVPCFLGQVECFGGAAGEDGRTCATARVVSRWVASQDGVLENPSNEETDNGDDLPTSAGTGCRDSGNDLYYRAYLKAGETLALLLAYHPTIDMMAKIYRGTDCQDASLIRCVDENLDGPTVGSDPPVDTEAEIHSFVADAEGWYTVVLDGRTADDLGRSMVRFNLFNCPDVDCCCY